MEIFNKRPGSGGEENNNTQDNTSSSLETSFITGTCRFCYWEDHRIPVYLGNLAKAKIDARDLHRRAKATTDGSVCARHDGLIFKVEKTEEKKEATPRYQFKRSQNP
jgi:hypothetical protein